MTDRDAEISAPPAPTTEAAEAQAPIRLFLAGPTWVRPDVREQMLGEIVAHRSPRIQRLYASLAGKLARVFRTVGDVYVATSSATLVMQAAIQSTVSRRVLHLVNGAFSERWHEISGSLGREADRVEVPWGEAVDPDLVREAAARKRYDAVAFAHCETSTGVLNPAREIAAAVRESSDALVLVDAVSSLAGARVECDAWGLDVVLTASQKALSLPPGLAFVAVSDRALRRAEAVPGRGLYTDLLRYRAKHESSGTITTPAVSLLYAADYQLSRVLDEGLEARWARHEANRARVESWAAPCGFSFLAAVRRSPTMSCLRPPAGVDAAALVGSLEASGWTVAGGYGKLKPETIRIGHMGEVGPGDLDRLLPEVREHARRLGGP